MPVCFLVDNGSLRAASTLNLRRIAEALAEVSGHPIQPVSLLHSSRVSPEELEGKSAEILEPALRRHLDAGERDFFILPLFFGPSLALSDYLPKRVRALRRKFPDLRIRIAPCLFDLHQGSDLRLIRIVHERVLAAIPSGEKPAVVLVDHGSPAPEVTYVRNFLAGQLSALLGDRVSRVAAASMERREGPEFCFNEPLLEDILTRPGFNTGRVVVAMLFLSPGRHAGEEGDVAQICRRAEGAAPGLSVTMTGLVGDHPGLIPILVDRLRQGEDLEPGEGD
jgi:sirohydrochlorin ferrochelatase